MIKKRRKAKKFLSLLLSVAMALTMFAGVGQMEVKAGETDSGAEVTHTDHEGWKDLNSITHIKQSSDIPQGTNYEYQGLYHIVEGGNYYLSSDIESSYVYGAIQIGNGSNSCEVTICLAGHTISAKLRSSNDGVVYVNPNCKLTVVDCSTDKSGGIVDSNNKGAAIYSKGNLKVNGVKDLSGSYGIREYIGQSVPDDSDPSAVSIEINDANITGTESSVYASGVKTLAIKSTTCTGNVFAPNSKNMTVEDSTIDGNSDSAIKFWNGKGSKLVVNRSVLKTEATDEYVLESIGSNGPVEIEVIDSELLSTFSGLKALGGEKVTIRNSDIICAPAENVSNQSGHAIFYQTHREAGRSNSLTIEGGKVRGINAGMVFGFPSGDPLDLTLSGTIDFGESNPSYPVFGIRYNDRVNLHMDGLGLITDKLFINIEGSVAGEIPNVICDSDYSSYFVFPQYLVSGKETAEGKYLLNLTQRSITTQPTEANPQVTVNDTNNVTYQWYQAAAVEKEITDGSIDNTIAAEDSCGSYGNGYWKPEEISYPGLENPYYQYQIGAYLSSGGQIVLEAPIGSSLDNLGNYLWCVDVNTGDLVKKENVDGKLYFTIPSAGTYFIVSANMDNQTNDCSFKGNEQIKITFKGIEIKEAVEGSTQSRLVTSEPGSFCCKATWAAGTPFEYSTVSNAVTVTQPIEPTKYAVTVTDGTTASAEYAAGETVTITANVAPAGKEFDKWEVVSGDVTLADASQATTTFTMPENAVEVKATYKDTSEAPPESGGTTPDTNKILDKAREIVTSKISNLSVSNLTTDKDIENAIKTELLSDDKTKTVGSDITVNKTAAAVGTNGQIAINVKLSLNDKNITFDLNKTIPALVGRNITVTVKDGNGDTVSGATVKVMLGETKKEEKISEADGKCTFSGLPAGLYNIVITKGEVTKTAIANITTNNDTVSVELDTSSVGSSHLDVKGTTVPETAAKVEETVVSNLDALAEALKETDPAVNSYKVEMAVEAKADTQVSKNTQSEMVKEANKGETGAENKATNIDFLDIVIQKTITKNSVEQKPELITDTGTIVMEIIIPFNFTGKTKVKVLREHNGVVEKFNETTTGTDGTCKIDKANGLIILYATKFSTYAVSYVAEGEDAIVEPVAPTYPTYTGGGSVSVTVPATGITIEADKYEITKEGETVAIKAAIQPSNATDKKLTFTSSDEKVAKVDANGVITAVGNGTATITVKAANGITKTITVTVNLPSDENKEDGNTEDSSSTEEEAVTPAKVAANTIAINKGLKVSQTGSKINVSWGKVSDADGYLVYAAYCGTSFGKAVKTIKDPSSVSTTITKLNGKKLDLKKNFKVCVKAYKLVDGKKAAFGKSITAHIAGSKNTKETNGKEIKLTSKSKLALAVGKTSKIKAKAVLVDSAKKQLSDSHTKEFRYVSSNKKIAAVDKNGKITAKAKGTCYIYVYAKNGYAKKVTVTVK